MLARTALSSTCSDVRAVCVSLITESSTKSRSELTVYVLDKIFPSISNTDIQQKPFNTSTGSTTAGAAVATSTSTSNDVITHADVVAATKLTYSVLSSCLSKTKTKTHLSPLLRIHTIDSNNIPQKGTTVWYVQQKHVRIRDYLTRTDRALNPGVHAPMSVECLEGVLVGIHKEGNEEPFYTVSLSTPIPGSAGNTVREIQTSGYRYVTHFLTPLK
jgi:hypothetical protein